MGVRSVDPGVEKMEFKKLMGCIAVLIMMATFISPVSAFSSITSFSQFGSHSGFHSSSFSSITGSSGGQNWSRSYSQTSFSSFGSMPAYGSSSFHTSYSGISDTGSFGYSGSSSVSGTIYHYSNSFDVSDFF